MEWPPRSGKYQSFPEIDKAAWLTIKEAGKKINVKQAALIRRAQKKIRGLIQFKFGKTKILAVIYK